MAADLPGDADTKAARLLTKLSDDEFIRLSKAQVVTLVDAIKQDLDTLAHKETDDEDRLTKLETQTQVLAEAVIAITKTEETLAPAISAVKAEMHGPHSTERKPDGSASVILDVAGLTDIARKVRETHQAAALRGTLANAPQDGKPKKLGS
jgi:cell division septum initiation protein DivIVA